MGAVVWNGSTGVKKKRTEQAAGFIQTNVPTVVELNAVFKAVDEEAQSCLRKISSRNKNLNNMFCPLWMHLILQRQKTKLNKSHQDMKPWRK